MREGSILFVATKPCLHSFAFDRDSEATGPSLETTCENFSGGRDGTHNAAPHVEGNEAALGKGKLQAELLATIVHYSRRESFAVGPSFRNFFRARFRAKACFTRRFSPGFK
jgi:hypothetical protein